ncbi:MAG: AMP-binding protein, partial [Bacillota bacterium]|nr:AMP-binding protein [Bacillota bacterium]
IKKINRTNGTTMYMTLLTAYNILLSKYSGQEDIVVGSPIAGRPHAQLQDIVGMFVNTLAMRNYPSGEKTFSEFLQEVKKNALNAYENEEYQFDELVEKLDIRKDISRNAIFDTMFVLQNIDIEEIDMEGIMLKPYKYGLDISKFDITLTAVETEKEISFNLEYCTKLFKRESVERIRDHFINILKEIAENPEKKISEIEMLTEEEKQKILVGFNDTKAEYPKDKTIYELFEEQVEKTPENIALVYEEKELSYKKLNERANQLARTLRKKGVGPEKIVGIMVERSLEMIVGIMGILKAGGAYLPIDPEYPKERIEYMLEDSNVDILLTQTQLVDKSEFSGNIIEIDREDLYVGDSSNLEKINISNDLAYVIYTSGTTGKPKGVMIEQRSILNTILWRKNEYKLGDKDVLLSLISFSFDGSIHDIFAPLSSGSRIIILNSRSIKNPLEIKKCIISNQITNLTSVVTLYRTLLECSEETELKSLRTVTLGGEKITERILTESKRNNS